MNGARLLKKEEAIVKSRFILGLEGVKYFDKHDTKNGK